jgi:enoyl-CoA hydratase
MSFETLIYATDGPIAEITLNRPAQLNTIVPPMPDEFEAAVEQATLDHQIKVIVLRGAGRAFCAGYAFSGGFLAWPALLDSNGRWDLARSWLAPAHMGRHKSS